MGERLHFSIGPVQAFIAQSRRTRDLWSSSWLLSYLAGQAIEAVLNDGGTMVLPRLDAPTLKDLLQRPHASLPNRFVAKVKDVESTAKAAEEAIAEAWTTICDAVWKDYVEPVEEHGSGTREIWQRQTQNFWNVTWAIGADLSTLDKRKNWRSAPSTIEGGDHCTMMGDWQELSGFFRSTQRKEQDGFWKAFESQQKVRVLDLQDDERLCALALVKRFFAKKDVYGTLLPYSLDMSNWPSTYYMSAIPWLQQVNASDDEFIRQAEDYAQHCKQAAHTAALSEKARATNIEKLSTLPRLDGNFFRKSALEDADATPLKDGADRAALVDQLKQLHHAVGRPPAFYAMVHMDGDGLGKLLRKAGDKDRDSQTGKNVEAVTTALVSFARDVPHVVESHSGVTIYAGGDDVLAMLPLPDALPCALALESKYRDAFLDSGLDPKLCDHATISGAIVYAHHLVPFRQVLSQAHRLLDTVAKEQTGRASLATAVFKPSGLAVEWSCPWKGLKSADASILDRVIELIRNGTISNSFLYALRERYSLLTGIEQPAPGRYGRFDSALEPQRLLVAEALVGKNVPSGPDGEELRNQTHEMVEAVLHVCRRQRREPDGQLAQDTDNTFALDGAMLARFLESGGKGIDR